ncbi:MAG: glycerophosphodiester phosphodiesterase [Candidatus Korarchaeota archaeon]|nr:glycerophosphodiester phosphodiesterase [Candidatus Korarchaeota archaeon]
MRPLIVGHRANTLTKLRLYLQLGVDAVEVDITGSEVRHITSIKPATLREALLRRIFFPEPKGESLDRIVREIVERDVALVVDLKTPEVDPKIFSSLPGDGRVAISSKYHNTLRKLRPELKGNYLMLASIQDRPARPAQVMADAMADGLSVELSYVDEDLLSEMREVGGLTYVWTVNDAEQALALARMGVGAITTDRPDLVIPALENGYVRNDTGRRLYRRLTEE